MYGYVVYVVSVYMLHVLLNRPFPNQSYFYLQVLKIRIRHLSYIMSVRHKHNLVLSGK